MKNKVLSNQKGFTLLEILLVVAAIAILAGIIIIAINPAKQLGDTRNAQRHSDVRTILDAIHQYGIDNSGELPSTTILTTSDCINTTGSAEICATDTSNCSNFTNLDDLTLDGIYLTELPNDPADVTTSGGTGYHAIKNSNGRVTVCAPHAEQDEEISVSR